MGTSCRIAILYYVDDHDEEHYRSIHCHFDGYLLTTGTRLLKHYNNYKDALLLVSLGDIRGLCDTVEETFLEKYDNTTYRDELGILDLLNTWNTAGETNLYVFAYDKWWWYDNNKKQFRKLKKIIGW